jgi:hypothetical protein
VGLIFPVLEIVTIPAAAIASRIAISTPAVRESAYRFAAYPGLIVGYLALISVALAWPLAFVMPLAATGGFLPHLLTESGMPLPVGGTEYWLLVWAAFFVLTALWWIGLARIIGNRKLEPKKLFFPFVDFPSSTITMFLNKGAIVLMALAVGLGIFA